MPALGCLCLPSPAHRKACPARVPRVSVVLAIPPSQGRKPHFRLSLCLAELQVPPLTLATAAATATGTQYLPPSENILHIAAFRIWSSSLQNSHPPNGRGSESQLQIQIPGPLLSPAKSAPCCSLHASGDGELTTSQEILPSLHGARSSKVCPLCFFN